MNVAYFSKQILFFLRKLGIFIGNMLHSLKGVVGNCRSIQEAVGDPLSLSPSLQKMREGHKRAMGMTEEKATRHGIIL